MDSPNFDTLAEERDRVAHSTTFLKMYENCNPRHVDEQITDDETWQYYFEPLRKSNERSMGTERWESTQNCKAVPFQEGT